MSELHKRSLFIIIPWTKSGLFTLLTYMLTALFSKNHFILYGYSIRTPLRAVQEAAHCIVGQDYPMPMIDHDSARDENLASMKAAYAAQGGAEKIEDAPSKGQKRKATGTK
jgi:hypothetical protein